MACSSIFNKKRYILPDIIFLTLMPRKKWARMFKEIRNNEKI
jgi:hypothetical protein